MKGTGQTIASGKSSGGDLHRTLTPLTLDLLHSHSIFRSTLLIPGVHLHSTVSSMTEAYPGKTIALTPSIRSHLEAKR